MKRLAIFVFSFGLALTLRGEEARLAVPSAVSASPLGPATDEERLEALDPVQVKQALSLLLTRHVGAAGLDEDAMNRASLRGLLADLAPGVELTDGVPPQSPQAPFRAEILDSRFGYVRLGSLRAENLVQLDASLQDFSRKNIEGVILDLRATPVSEDFEMAAKVAGRFSSKGSVLFTMLRPADKQETILTSSSAPLYPGLLVVVANKTTSGAAEALAASLRQNAQAIMVGETTAGRPVEFGTVDLGQGHYLRLATAEARVVGLAPVYPHGLPPDIEVRQDPRETDTILSGSLEKGVGGYVFEQERARFNEATLVAGTNPELATEEFQSNLLDRPLQRAVDLLTAIRFFESGQ